MSLETCGIGKWDYWKTRNERIEACPYHEYNHEDNLRKDYRRELESSNNNGYENAPF